MSWPNDVTKKDLKIEEFIGSGPGGQHRNKTATCIRITHIPTGIKATATSEKSQLQNKKNAFKILCSRLAPLMKAALNGPAPEPPNKARIRTYNIPDRRVVDDRVSGKQYDPHNVLYGKGLNEVISDVIMAQSGVE